MLPDTPLILISGLCCDGWFFWPQVARFNRLADGRPRHVVAPDWVMHADPQDGTGALPRLAARLASAWHRGGLDGALVVGHSLGGLLATLVAANGGFRPAGLLLIDAMVPIVEDRKPALRDLATRIRGAANPDQGKQRERMGGVLRDYVFQHLSSGTDDRAVLAAIVDRMSAADPFRNALLVESALVVDFAAALKQVPGRVAGLAAEPARLPTDRLLQIRPDAAVAQVKGAGHFLTLLAPEAVNAAIQAMMESAPISGPGLVPLAAAR